MAGGELRARNTRRARETRATRAHNALDARAQRARTQGNILRHFPIRLESWGCRRPWWLYMVVNCGYMCKKVRNCLVVSGKITIFAGETKSTNNMAKIITANNSLTGERETIAGPMGDETARQALAAETKRRRKARKKCAWTHLKIENYEI